MKELEFNKKKLLLLNNLSQLWEINLLNVPLNMILKFNIFMANLFKQQLKLEFFKVLLMIESNKFLYKEPDLMILTDN